MNAPDTPVPVGFRLIVKTFAPGWPAAVMGTGAFWLVLAMLFTWSVRKAAPVPFSLAWWAFTFPLGAFTPGSQRLSEVTGKLFQPHP